MTSPTLPTDDADRDPGPDADLLADVDRELLRARGLTEAAPASPPPDAVSVGEAVARGLLVVPETPRRFGVPAEATAPEGSAREAPAQAGLRGMFLPDRGRDAGALPPAPARARAVDSAAALVAFAAALLGLAVGSSWRRESSSPGDARGLRHTRAHVRFVGAPALPAATASAARRVLGAALTGGVPSVMRASFANTLTASHRPDAEGRCGFAVDAQHDRSDAKSTAWVALALAVGGVVRGDGATWSAVDVLAMPVVGGSADGDLEPLACEALALARLEGLPVTGMRPAERLRAVASALAAALEREPARPSGPPVDLESSLLHAFEGDAVRSLAAVALVDAATVLGERTPPGVTAALARHDLRARPIRHRTTLSIGPALPTARARWLVWRVLEAETFASRIPNGSASDTWREEARVLAAERDAAIAALLSDGDAALTDALGEAALAAWLAQSR